MCVERPTISVGPNGAAAAMGGFTHIFSRRRRPGRGSAAGAGGGEGGAAARDLPSYIFLQKDIFHQVNRKGLRGPCQPERSVRETTGGEGGGN